MKILSIIIFLWVIYRINKFILGIQITKSQNRKKENIDRKSRMDIQDAEYEEVE